MISRELVLFIAVVLSILWGIYLAETVIHYQRIKASPVRRRQDVVIALRRTVVAFCTWLFPFSFVFRLICVLLGVGDEISGQIVFYALLGANFTGSIFCIASLKYD